MINPRIPQQVRRAWLPHAGLHHGHHHLAQPPRRLPAAGLDAALGGVEVLRLSPVHLAVSAPAPDRAGQVLGVALDPAGGGPVVGVQRPQPQDRPDLPGEAGAAGERAAGGHPVDQAGEPLRIAAVSVTDVRPTPT